jgi:high-affinity nickel-transport protein
MHVHVAGAQHGAAAGVCHEHVLAAAPTRVALRRRPLLRAFEVGLVHGLAGSAAIALLIVSAIPQPFWATLYLVIFCFGTIVGMSLITTAIATPFTIAAERMSRFHSSLMFILTLNVTFSNNY